MVGNLVLLQCIGIPMGINSVSSWANLFLCDYEADYDYFQTN